jgi:hypothetical protein
VPPEDEEALRSGGDKKDDKTEDVSSDEEVPRLINRDDSEAGAWADGMLDIGESRGQTWSSAPSSSMLIVLSRSVAEWEDGSKACVPRGCVPGIKPCILR